MVGIVKAFPHILYHLPILLPYPQVDSKSFLDLLDLLLLVLSLDNLIILGRLLDRIIEHILFSLVHLLHIFP